MNDALEDLKPFWRKVHTLRAFVLGDYHKGGSVGTQNDEYYDTERYSWRDGMGRIFSKTVEVGRSNQIYRAVRTVVQQTSYRRPAFDFPDAPPDVSSIMGLYLNQVMGPKPLGCDARVAHQLKLADFVIGGQGASWQTMMLGKPVTRYVDTLNVLYDPNEEYRTDMGWVAVIVVMTMSQWEREYPGFRKRYAKAAHDDGKTDVGGTNANPDGLGGDEAEVKEAMGERSVPVAFYYDTEGEAGHFAMFPVMGGEILEEPIFPMEDNPHKFWTGASFEPFLPVDIMFSSHLPGTGYPISFVELMAPLQVELNRIQDAISVMASNLPFVTAEEGAYSEAELQKLSNRKANEVIFNKPNKPPAQVVSTPELSATALQRLNTIEQQLTAASGVNPYSSGDKVEGISYATEVKAIQAESGLTKSTIAAECAMSWSRVASQMIANGHQYDFTHREIHYDDLILEFGPENPIGDYLLLDVAPVVDEDRIVYEGPEDRVARSLKQFEYAMQAVQTGIIPPNTLIHAYTGVLEAFGEKNTSRHFEAPQAAPQMAPETEAQAEEAAAGDVQ